MLRLFKVYVGDAVIWACQVVYRGVYQGHLQGRYPTTSGVTPREPKADLADLADFSRGGNYPDEKRKELCY
jgi:hypothetical protein